METFWKMHQSSIDMFIVPLKVSLLLQWCLVPCILAVAMVVGEKFYRYVSIGVPSYEDVFGTTGWVIIYTGVFLPFFAPLMTVTIVSLEHYYAICKRIQHLVIWKMKYKMKLIASSWTVGIIITAKLMPGYVSITFTCIIWPKDEKYNTFPNRVGKYSFVGFNVTDFSKTKIGASVYTNLAQTVPFFFSITANTIFYMKIIQHNELKSKSYSYSKQL